MSPDARKDFESSPYEACRITISKTVSPKSEEEPPTASFDVNRRKFIGNNLSIIPPINNLPIIPLVDNSSEKTGE